MIWSMIEWILCTIIYFSSFGQMSPCQLSCSVISSPIGPYDVSGCINGLHSVQLSPEVTDQNFLQTGSPDIVLQPRKSNNRHLDQLEAWMNIFRKVGAISRRFNLSKSRGWQVVTFLSPNFVNPKKRSWIWGDNWLWTTGNFSRKNIRESIHQKFKRILSHNSLNNGNRILMLFYN